MVTEIRVNGDNLEFEDDELGDTRTLSQLDASVKTTGNQTIAGIKTFSSSPIVPTPTTDMQASTKLYVDIGTLYITTIATSAAPTPARASKRNMFTVTALSNSPATFAVPSGTALGGVTLLIRIKDDGTARTLAWNAIYRAGTDIALPTTTVINKTMYVGFIYNAVVPTWDLMMVTEEF